MTDRSDALTTPVGEEALRSLGPLERVAFRGAIGWQFSHANNIEQHLARYGLKGTVRLRAAMVWWALTILVGWVLIISSLTGPPGFELSAAAALVLVWLSGMYRASSAAISGRAWRAAQRGHAQAADADQQFGAGI